MSTIQEQVFALLSPLVPNGVYPNAVAAAAAQMPYVVYHRNPGHVENVLDSQTPPIDNTVFEIDCWGHTYAEADVLATTIRNALRGWVINGLPAGVQTATEHDLYEEDVKAHRVVMEFSVWS